MTATMSDALEEINHHGLVLTSAMMLSLEATVEARNAAAASASKTKKRKAPTDIVSVSSSSDKENKPQFGPEDDDDGDEEEEEEDIDSDDSRLSVPKWSCGQIRGKIRKFVEKDKVMKVGEFQTAIGVSSKSYYAFMKMNGPWKGAESHSFINAHRFFMKREVLGLDKKNKKKKTKAAAKISGGQDGSVKKIKTETAASKKTSEEEFARRYDVSNIVLPGEETADVEVYDHCDEIRKKIRAALRDPDMTRTAFCREISKTFPERRDDKSKALQTATLASFLSKSGRREGNTSLIFYAAYVFFEKLRIRDGKPKTVLREEMEDVWDLEGGFDRKPAHKYIISRSSYLYCDEYGRIRSAPY